MWTKPFGQTGKDVSVISFGGMRFADPENIDANAQLLVHARRRGVNYFDTAPFYCKEKSEEIFGAAVAPLREMGGEFYYSTKCSSPDGDDLRRSLERSLKRMRIERVDFFHIWCIVTMDEWAQRLKGGAVDAAIRAKEEGLISHLLVSSHLAGNELAEVLRQAPFEGVTLGYCAINFPYRQQALDTAGEMDLGVVTMNPLGGGLIPRHAERFDYIKAPGDPSVVAAALRFNVSQPAVTSALVGFTTAQHIDEAADAVEGFSGYGAAHVEGIRARVTEQLNGLCTGCGYCLPCPVGIDVPRMMDAYNMKLLAGEDQAVVNRLKWHWATTPADAAKCTRCGLCVKRCTQKLPVSDRMGEIAALG